MTHKVEWSKCLHMLFKSSFATANLRNVPHLLNPSWEQTLMTHKVEWSKFQLLPKCCRISNLEASPHISSRYVISRLDFSFWFRGTCVTSVQLRRCRAHWSRTSSPPRLDVGEAGQVQPVLLCPSLSRCSSLCFSRYSSPGIPAVHSCILTIRFRI